MEIPKEVSVKALEYLELFEQAVVNYTPEVIDTVLLLVRIDRGGNLIAAAAIFLASITAIRIGLRLWRRGKKIEKECGPEYYRSEETGPLIFGSALFIFGNIFAIAAIGCLVNIWNWVGVFEPKLYLAWKVFGKLF